MNLKLLSPNKTPKLLPESCNCHSEGQSFCKDVFLPGNRSSSVRASMLFRASTLSLLQLDHDVSVLSVCFQQVKASLQKIPLVFNIKNSCCPKHVHMHSGACVPPCPGTGPQWCQSGTEACRYVLVFVLFCVSLRETCE